MVVCPCLLVLPLGSEVGPYGLLYSTDRMSGYDSTPPLHPLQGPSSADRELSTLHPSTPHRPPMQDRRLSDTLAVGLAGSLAFQRGTVSRTARLLYEERHCHDSVTDDFHSGDAFPDERVGGEQKEILMKVLCLGGAGRICREAAFDLVEFSDFERITIGDCDEKAGQETVAWLDDDRVDFKRVDIFDREAAVKLLSEYDIVMDGTTISLNDLSTGCIADAGTHGINLNGFGEEYKYGEKFKANGKACVPGFGMTPGVTNMLAVHAAEQLDTVETVRVSHGAFRPVAFSSAITETTIVEYEPSHPARVVFEDGEFIQVPPFARPRDIELPAPYGTHPQYIIPHSETQTLAKYLANKGVRLIEVRGTWPPQNMRLIKTLYEWGFMRNDRVRVDGADVGIMNAIGDYLVQSPEGKTTDLYGYALHVEVIGRKNGSLVQHILTHTHPASDGSVEGWEQLRAYTRCVGIPMGIGVQLIASGQCMGTGALTPEEAFRPADIFAELEKRQIFIHEEISQL